MFREVDSITAILSQDTSPQRGCIDCLPKVIYFVYLSDWLDSTLIGEIVLKGRNPSLHTQDFAINLDCELKMKASACNQSTENIVNEQLVKTFKVICANKPDPMSIMKLI